ncbi:hypothetical protein GCM10007036_01270 [Alsobacter metallidurans]|uniref:Methyl-accepting chemotaxis protein n=1 Tax=Alsobacter metallidurans TaxID=340221 RepID=A0A917MHV1_9HYPH|nr:hypothetical protein GCM10007036_01270 [Alsobacter metallidurans]
MTGLALIALVAGTVVRVERSLAEQSTELARLSVEKLSDGMRSQAHLAKARLDTLQKDVARRLGMVAQRTDVMRAVQSRNVANISETLDAAGRAANLGLIAVVDDKIHVVGSSSKQADLLRVDQELRRTSLLESVAGLMADNQKSAPRSLSEMRLLDAATAHQLGMGQKPVLAMIFIEPMFDDFGDVTSLLIGFRPLRSPETVLDEFSQLTGSGVFVEVEDQIISVAGVPADGLRLRRMDGTRLLETENGLYVGSCAALVDAVQVCALAPRGDIYTLRDETVRIGEAHARRLNTWLAGAGLFAIVMAGCLMMLMAGGMAKALRQITNAVAAVAQGDWRATVSGAERRDEIGSIARAVQLVQRSLEERDRLRSDVAGAELVRKRSASLEAAIQRFDSSMRSVMNGIQGCVHSMNNSAQSLDGISRNARDEAGVTARASKQTTTSVMVVDAATGQLTDAIRSVSGRVSAAADVVVHGNDIALDATRKVGSLLEAADQIGAVVRLIEGIASQTNLLALNATIEAARAGEAGRGFAVVASEVKALAGETGKATDVIAGKVAAIQDATNDAVRSIEMIAQSFSDVLTQTTTIRHVVRDQSEATEQIAESVSSAFEGAGALCASVEKLSATVEDARAATVDVVGMAARMTDEARQLDQAVRSFLADVAAS